MVNGKGTSRPYVAFVGNSATEVTGSMHIVRFKKYLTLFDCGLIQLNDPMTSYKANKEQLKKIKPQDIDYIILSHIHVDHSGLIPALYAKGCQAHIYIPKGSLQFLKLLWADSLKIMESDCIKLKNKHGFKAPPLYSEAAIDRAVNRCIEIDYDTKTDLNKDMSFVYYGAGHIIHAAQVYLEMRDGNIIKRVGYTGDIGSGIDRMFTENRETLPYVNLMIGENTYNEPSRPNKPKDRTNDIQKILTIVDQSNKILLPTFSLQRTQEIIMVLYNNGILDKLPVYLDSSLANKICSIWEDNDGEFEKALSKIKIIETWEQSVDLQHKDEHCIIISASGFLSGGRIMAHLKTALSNPRNHLIFIGYAGENNLASQIKSTQKEVNIDGTVVKNNINITELRSFSSHASYEELMDYYSKQCRFDKIGIVHGQYIAKVGFCKALQNRLGNECKSSKVVCVNQDQKIYI